MIEIEVAPVSSSAAATGRSCSSTPRIVAVEVVLIGPSGKEEAAFSSEGGGNIGRADAALSDAREAGETWGARVTFADGATVVLRDVHDGISETMREMTEIASERIGIHGKTRQQADVIRTHAWHTMRGLVLGRHDYALCDEEEGQPAGIASEVPSMLLSTARRIIVSRIRPREQRRK